MEGTRKGYNPKKRGRASHHPIIAFIAEMKIAANFWLRPSNTGSANNIIAFLEETFTILKDKTVGLFRAHAGFYQKAVMEWLEDRKTEHIIAIKMYPNLKNAIKEKVKWIEKAGGIWVGVLEYRRHNWEKSRREVVIKQHIELRPQELGKLLFPMSELQP